MTLLAMENLREAASNPAVNAALRSRADVMAMIAQAEDAALRPEDPGGLPHAMRAALAARVARLTGCEDAAAHYLAGVDATHAPLADPAQTGGALLEFVDRAAADTAHVTARDLDGLRAAGHDEADIVRLCELIAFTAFQSRLLDSIRLIGGADG